MHIWVGLFLSFYSKIIYCYFFKIMLINALTLFLDIPNAVMVNEVLLSTEQNSVKCIALVTGCVCTNHRFMF